MATFKSWTNPKNNEERIYISGLVGQNQSKVFVVKQSADSFGFEYDIKAQIPEGVYSNKNDLINQAEQEIFKAAGSRIKAFEQVKQLCRE